LKPAVRVRAPSSNFRKSSSGTKYEFATYSVLRALAIDSAMKRSAGVLPVVGEAKNTRLSGRVPAGLIEAAKKRAHVSSDTELLELALSRLALEDDFGARLVRRKGSVPADIDLAI